MNIRTVSFIAFVLGLTAAGAAQADDGCCYQRVTSPPIYGAVHEQVMVSPPGTVALQSPAEYGEVIERIVTRPARTYARPVPAITQSVAERVLVQPRRKVWSVTRDAWGREIGCWIEQPAVYSTVYRTVVVQPAGVTYETEPAEYATVRRPVQVRPAQTYYQSTPATYATRTRQVLVQPGYDSWQPLGGHHRGYGY
jgi:hypothetical protein